MNALHALPRFPARLTPFDLRTTALLRTDVLVVGSGIAGACAALHAADAGADVLLVAKGDILDTNTAYAQGGIAVVQLSEDSTESHVADTLRVGAGLADPGVARAARPSALNSALLGPARAQRPRRRGLRRPFQSAIARWRATR
jgi:glycine/D-amino acid oxidase-like deaminating enzyme